MEALSLNELAELLLAALYEETQNLKHSNYFLSMDDIAAALGIEDRGQVIDACHLLEEKSYVLLTFDHLTTLSAFITPIGENHVREGGETGIIAEYQRYRAALALNTPVPDSPGPLSEPPLASSFRPPHLPSSRGLEKQETPATGEGITHLIASMELLIRNAPSLPESSRKDLAADLKTLELQLSKSSVNRSVVDTISAELRSMPTLAPLVDLLLSMKETK